MEEQKKKKLKTWQIVLIVLGVLALIGAISEGNSSNTNSSNPSSSSGVKFSSNEKLTILDSQLTYGDYGNLVIEGTAKNVAGKKLNYAELDAKFYDDAGAVLGTSLGNINNLGSEESWKFKIYYLGTDSYKVDHYTIDVGSTW